MISGVPHLNGAETPVVITVAASPRNIGDVTGGGHYQPETNVVVAAAVTNDCYYFKSWTVAGKVVSTNFTYMFAAARSETLTANFSPYLYKVQTASAPANGGVASGGGSKACGSSVKVTAQAKKGFRFVNWSQDGNVVSAKAVYPFTISGDLLLTANFVNTTPPTLTLTSPTGNETTTSGTVTITGNATDNVSVAGVYYSVSASEWIAAENDGGWIKWSFTTALALGSNVIQIYALDSAGLASGVKTVTIVRDPLETFFPIETTDVIEHPQLQIAFDGNNYLTVFQTQLSGSGVPTAQLVSQAGTLAAPQLQIPVSGGSDTPCVAFDGANYLMAWSDYDNQIEGGGIHAQFVSTSGAAIGDRFQISQSTTVDSFNTIVYGGGVYFVEWSDYGSSPDAIYGAMVSPSGDIAVSDFQISPSGEQHEAGQGAAASDGTNFLATWYGVAGSASVMGCIIGPDGSFAGDPFVIYPKAATGITVDCAVFDGTKYLVLVNPGFGEGPAASSHIIGRFVTTAGILLSNQIVITADAGPQLIPCAAFDGAEYMVTWNQGFNIFSTVVGPSTIKARLFDSEGRPTTSEFALFTSQDGRTPGWGSVLWNGNKFVVATGLGKLRTPEPNLSYTNVILSGAFIVP